MTNDEVLGTKSDARLCENRRHRQGRDLTRNLTTASDAGSLTQERLSLWQDTTSPLCSKMIRMDAVICDSGHVVIAVGRAAPRLAVCGLWRPTAPLTTVHHRLLSPWPFHSLLINIVTDKDAVDCTRIGRGKDIIAYLRVA